MIHIEHYGLHRVEGDIPLLVQQDRVDHVLGIHMDFEVQVRLRRPCTHQIDLDAAEYHPILDRFANDSLFQTMLPIPRVAPSRPLYIEETPVAAALLRQLVRLTSPGSFSVMVPFWTNRPHVHGQVLRETNLQPLILHGFRLEHAAPLAKVMEAAVFSPRPLIILGTRDTTPILGRAERITTSVTLQDLEGVNMEGVGAWALRQHMLGTT